MCYLTIISLMYLYSNNNFDFERILVNYSCLAPIVSKALADTILNMISLR